jgi:hypothetical protein
MQVHDGVTNPRDCCNCSRLQWWLARDVLGTQTYYPCILFVTSWPTRGLLQGMKRDPLPEIREASGRV